jgi:leucine dehydrogenase
MHITDIPVKSYEKVVHCHDPRNGLQAIISIHNTILGPALGGLRMWPYTTPRQALLDANRLAKGMTYKSAVADTGLGGGKAVIIGHAPTDKSERLLRAMGRFVDTLGGLYITAEDVGTTVDDMVIVKQETPHVVGLPHGMGGSGNPAPFTALGVFFGIMTCVQRALHTDSLKGVRVVVQGCGNVASYLCMHLHEAGAELIVTDIAPAKAQRLAQQYAARLVAPEEIYDVPCEIYAPCALGGTLNDDILPRLQCQIVAGSTNNQCLTTAHGDALRQRGIVYAPDFVINAGGLMNVALERTPEGYSAMHALSKVQTISHTLRAILDTAACQDISTQRAALLLAKEKLAKGHSTQAREGGKPSSKREKDDSTISVA